MILGQCVYFAQAGGLNAAHTIFFEKKVTKNAAISTIFKIQRSDTAHFKALLILLKKGKITFFDRTNGFPTKWTFKK